MQLVVEVLNMKNTKLMRLPEVINATGMGRSTIYARIQATQFPRPITLNPNGRGAVAWLSTDVDKWINERIAASRM